MGRATLRGDVDHINFGQSISFGHLYGSSGLPYRVPDSLQGGQNLGFMFLPNYRAWVTAFSVLVCLGSCFVIGRTRLGAYLRAATENPTLVRALRRASAPYLGDTVWVMLSHAPLIVVDEYERPVEPRRTD